MLSPSKHESIEVPACRSTKDTGVPGHPGEQPARHRAALPHHVLRRTDGTPREVPVARLRRAADRLGALRPAAGPGAYPLLAALRSFPAAQPAARDAMEIGRASCWEKGWQY